MLQSLQYALIKFTQDNNLTLVKEYRFDPNRRWKSDYFIPEINCLVEYEGLVHSGKGGHQTKKGYTNNCEKYNRACLLGFKLLRYTSLNTNDCLKDLNELINKKPC